MDIFLRFWISLNVWMNTLSPRWYLRKLSMSVRSAKNLKTLAKIFHYVKSLLIESIRISILLFHNRLNLVQWIKKSLKALPWFGDLIKMLAYNISPQIKDLLHLIMTKAKRSLRFFLLILDLLVWLKNLLLIVLGWKKLRVNLLTILLGHNKF
jgi:hypothetical protein